MVRHILFSKGSPTFRDHIGWLFGFAESNGYADGGGGEDQKSRTRVVFIVVVRFAAANPVTPTERMDRAVPRSFF